METVYLCAVKIVPYMRPTDFETLKLIEYQAGLGVGSTPSISTFLNTKPAENQWVLFFYSILPPPFYPKTRPSKLTGTDQNCSILATYREQLKSLSTGIINN